MLERQGPRVVFVTNRDFEDVLFIGRMDKERIYDLHWRKPKPLVEPPRLPRDRRPVRRPWPRAASARQRRAATSSSERLAAYAGEDVAVAICCLFSYLDGEHERRAAAAVRGSVPAAHVSLSHEVSPALARV